MSHSCCIDFSQRTSDQQKRKKKRSELPPHMAICNAMSEGESYHRGRKEYHGEAELTERNSWG